MRYYLNMSEAFTKGFIKRAAEFGISKAIAEALLKEADLHSMASGLGKNVGAGLGHVSSPMGIHDGISSALKGWNAGSFNYHGQTQLPQVNSQNAIGNHPLQLSPQADQIHNHLQSLKSVQPSINNPKQDLMADLGSTVDV